MNKLFGYTLFLVVCFASILAAVALPSFGADSKTDEAVRRDAVLEESLRRLERTKEQIRQEILIAKQELNNLKHESNALKEEIIKIKNQETNQVIIVKIILPSTTRPISISAEKE